MKFKVEIDLAAASIIVAACVIAALLILFVSGVAGAQTPTPRPDIDLARSGSTYPLKCQPTEPIDKLVQICAVRTDLEGDPIELGCVAHTTLDVASLEVTVARTPFIDASIRCYAIDSEGNVSDISDNAGLADFTPNGRPWVEVHP